MKGRADLETEALVDLQKRARALRRRVLFPFLIAAIVAGHVFAIARAFDVTQDRRIWIVEDGESGYYLLPTPPPTSRWGIFIAFLEPVLPVAGAGWVAYVVLRFRMRSAWRTACVREKKLDPVWTEINARRFS